MVSGSARVVLVDEAIGFLVDEAGLLVVADGVDPSAATKE